MVAPHPSPPTESGITPAGSIEAAVGSARRAFESGRTRPLAWRRGQLDALQRMLVEHTDEIQEAMQADLGKNPVETYLSEVRAILEEARLANRQLRRWTRDRRVRAPLSFGRTRAYIHREPLGTVAIIGPWNYPINLLLVPLVGALAAGNAAVLKPSELTPTCSALVARLVPQYLDPEAVQVVEGGVPETTELLAQRFDHIFYTGNGAVGSIVLAAAAPHLTPVTLELGGKSPVWVDASAPLEKTARALAWAKFSNCGQTCVAPDYVLTTPDLAPRLAEAIAAAVVGMYGADPKRSPDYGRIVTTRHAQRLAGLLGAGTTVTGGQVDIAERYIAPTVLLDVPADAPVMQDEIFGPVLPIVTVPDHRAAIDVINGRPKPLALYVFTASAEVREDFQARTSSGGLAFGAVMLQVGIAVLPFGGVGASGMGAYHGEASMRTFSHERSVLQMLPGPDPSVIGRPPFTALKRRLVVGRSTSTPRTDADTGVSA